MELIARANVDRYDSGESCHAKGTHDKRVGVVRRYLEKHCFHATVPMTATENDLRVDTLAVDLSDVEALGRWQGMLDQVNLGEMPPESEPPPDPIVASRSRPICGMRRRLA